MRVHRAGGDMLQVFFALKGKRLTDRAEIIQRRLEDHSGIAP